MARMIPDLDPQTIENDGERQFYTAAARLPKEYTVFYSFKFLTPEEHGHAEALREADFVIVHPALGYLVVEVKQGEVAYKEGQWQIDHNGTWAPLKNPVEQARTAMFAIREQYRQTAPTEVFPLKIKYGVAFPHCNAISGTLPPDLDENSIFLQTDLDTMEEKILILFNAESMVQQRQAADILINKVLGPSFKIYVRLDQQIEQFNRQAEKLLTEEQQRILDETELDRQKIFFGSAGTGKTFLAMEKANRLAADGHQVLLTCFNKNLARYMNKELYSPKITVANFHDYLLRTLQEQNPSLSVPQDQAQWSQFFSEVLPEAGFDYFASLPEQEKFSALIVDEGQDFHEEWFMCLQSMVQDDGHFYIFADPGQSLFTEDNSFLNKLPLSRHRLTQNLRNTQAINNWLAAFIPKNMTLKSRLQAGMPVSTFVWEDAAAEKKLIEDEGGRLVSQGIKPKRITILSPNKKEKSSLAETASLKGWPIGDINDVNPNAIRFSTIRSFKGLEADVVFLIGIKEGTQACTPADIYVGSSRARFLLYVFHHQHIQIKP
ncbi:nuclease-related domain-containing DEAD/DEAH box helicase [Dethiobacter alkaliphilus]|uniref:NERD domain protein n=1 Tax=Dethiobacter alkaliphilus AHT 1 TaxID=555088 RepID=C0GCZ0_DETAL|nr:NERD domain-containing protein [Dethiobacter alkaliphilus]EEG79075.1 NERD domain protein [Dethiobacter alkaliphilus AHT 1]